MWGVVAAVGEAKCPRQTGRRPPPSPEQYFYYFGLCNLILCNPDLITAIRGSKLTYVAGTSGVHGCHVSLYRVLRLTFLGARTALNAVRCSLISCEEHTCTHIRAGYDIYSSGCVAVCTGRWRREMSLQR